jgi:hypothetical protein
MHAEPLAAVPETHAPRDQWRKLADQITVIRPLPVGWVTFDVRNDGVSYGNRSLGVCVISSVAPESDGLWWHHVSVSRRSRLPTWDDLMMCKRIFMGAEATAIQVLPAASKHVNIHPYCLHLWRCLSAEGPKLPDFTGGTGSI